MSDSNSNIVLHPNKKQKVDHFENNKISIVNQDSKSLTTSTNSSSNNNDYSQLFLYDWFLIEIGRYLISPNDRDLVNILCLNKKINERATVIFRHHYLNIPLQKQIIQLIKQEQFSQIQDIFQKNLLSLSPNNLNFDGFEAKDQPRDRPACLHAVFPEFNGDFIWNPRNKDCNYTCQNWDGDVNLICVALRYNLESLVRLLLFHPRLDFNALLIRVVREVFNWAVVFEHLDIMKFIISKCKENEEAQKEPRDWDKNEWEISEHFRTNVKCELDFLEFRFAAFGALFESKWNALNELLKFDTTIPLQEHHQQLVLDLAFQNGNPQIYEKIINSNFFVISARFLLQHSFQSGDDYILVVLKYLLFQTDRKKMLLSKLPNNEMERALNLVLEYSKEDGGKLALSFTYCLNLTDQLTSILKMRKWNDEELFEFVKNPPQMKGLFENNNSQTIPCLKAILAEFSENVQFIEKNFTSFLLSFRSKLECVKLIWNDKRTMRTQTWTIELLLHSIRRDMPKLTDFFLAQTSMSQMMHFKVGDLDIQTEVRNCCWFSFIQNYQDLGFDILTSWEEALEKYEIKWNEQIFDWSLKIACIREHISSISYFLDLPEDKSFWNEKRIVAVFCIACNQFDSILFSKLLKKFDGKVDLSFNNNEILRSLLNGHEWHEPSDEKQKEMNMILETMVSKLHFKGKKERNQFLELSEKKWPTFDFIDDYLFNEIEIRDSH